MRRTAVLTAVLILMTGTASGANWHLGLQGGVNSSGLKGDTPSGLSFGKKVGYAAGAVGEIQLGSDLWLSIQPMALKRGTTSEISVSGGGDPIDGPSIGLDYLAIPILAKIVANNGHTYVMGGINPAFLLEAKLEDEGQEEDVIDSFNQFALAADIGFGLMIPIGKPVVNFELRYEQSILNLASSEGTPDDDFLPVRFRSSGFQFLVGIFWPLGGE